MDNTKLFRLMGTISRQATTDINQKVAQYGLDNNLFLYLMRIVENEGISQVDLVNTVRVDKTTLSRALKKLETNGFIRKVTNPVNRKFNQLYPTDKAKNTYRTLYSLEKKYISKALVNLSTDEKTTLIALLTKIDSAL
ncbi:MarR family winged helix-turn-helix transcriptional regulator [Trichococcus ilyis]|jgi:DNA-binding MarR family transcriptional regulator|uniref:DNA-binding transcriptional regulator, MarR family n=1 Tax=Trichococcus ilyis TaxID=640938 RepID=A0A143YR08_9LACT|nr:MarR family transcriptional regulator [Trichococcus ilyis]CZQ96913.1 transcriptional regulator marr-type conserved site [Trichococcus ilyis]SEJ53167.1 DNA-binding transcriptional regulator, MarR family [Trichococcus ilyis]